MINPIIDKIPNHLKTFIVNQNYSNYTAQDHAVWRYVMHQNIKYLKNVAHSSYIQGLQKTGINTERIPRIEEMNDILVEIGWAAVCVDGFIPPAAFMEFQAHNILVIAADIRQINNIEYTPAPDIIHEAAGHAPIIANEEYATYLKLFGEIGHKAFSSKNDYEIYEAVRHLSILKEDTKVSKQSVSEAEKKIESLSKKVNMMSEMTQIRNLHWWTVEYGLIGELKKPKIYGAGLLSSIGESMACLSDNVKKLPYTIDAKNYLFDITTQQPQLFVAPDFKTLTSVLLEFSSSMALNTGGLEAVNKAIESSNIATCVYSSGLQITGIFTKAFSDEAGNLIYIKTNSPTSLNYMNKQLAGHDKSIHPNGFSSPVGEIKGIKYLENSSPEELNKLGIRAGEIVKFNYLSGIVVEGSIKSFTFKNGKLLLISFANCTVQYKNEILFDASWGAFDLAIGNEIISAFSGPADSLAYGFEFKMSAEKTHKINFSDEEKRIHSIYQNIKDARESKSYDLKFITETWERIENKENNWLLLLEIFELAKKITCNGFDKYIEAHLIQLGKTKPELKMLIGNEL
ncbi:MAG: aromatic amino acid hydroxylase [Chlorobi bacterium]|nr:aromatic amino acid hydroxylase [Chlorobiota bacterium]